MRNQFQNLEPTRQSLLLRMKNLEDQESCYNFFNQYWRLIYTVACRSGFSDAEAQDIVQDTLIAVCKNIKSFEYDPDRCSFRGWLLLLTRHRIFSQLRKKRSSPETIPLSANGASGVMPEDSIPDLPDPALEAIWNEEWQHNLITAASERVKKQVSAKHFQVYDLYVLQNWPLQRVTEALKVNAAQVYVAKHRVGKLMKQAIRAPEERDQ